MNKLALIITTLISTSTLAEPFAGFAGFSGAEGAVASSASSSISTTGSLGGGTNLGYSSAYSSSSISVANGQVQHYSVQTGGTGIGSASAAVIAPNFSAQSFWPR